MMKSGLVLLSMISPFLALRVNIQDKAEGSPLDLGLKQDEQAMMNDYSRAESVVKKISKANKQSWIVFMGDSNMRNTYYWWVMTKLKPQSTNFLQTKQFGRFWRDQSNENFTASKMNVDEWSDQDAIMEYEDGSSIRASFRFLHGSANEFHSKATNWNTLYRSEGTLSTAGNDRQIEQATNFTKTMDDADAIEPSKYAQYAAKHQLLLNLEKEVPQFAAKMKSYTEPDAVVLTEGWGGIPGCNRFQETMDLFKSKPKVNLVWSPIYVTNRVEKRYQCFAEKIAAMPKGDAANVQFVDMWDVAKKAGLSSREIVQDRWAHKAYIKHIKLGDDYMKVGTKRFEDAIENLSIHTQ